jgi:tRNA(fMet)-specific endonuclease VapC
LKKYLLDTNICIFYLKGRFQLVQKLEQVGLENCFVSEVTIAELKFGAENSEQVALNRQIVSQFQANMQVVPIFGACWIYMRGRKPDCAN